MAKPAPRGFTWSGYLLGFSLGGFFDGILLHQILQWHHLLSAINPQDIRFQVAADGYFHALMYGLAAAGLWLLWRFGGKGEGGRLLLANVLLGFGAWHVVDALGSHWVTGIHRIRVDSDNPLAWDLGWLAAFGLGPLLAGWLLRRRAGHSNGGGIMARAIATILIGGTGLISLRPPSEAAFTTALFAPGVSAAEAFLAVSSIGGTVAWMDPTGQVVVFEPGAARRGFQLYRRGAILVTGAGLPSGCFGAARLTPRRPPEDGRRGRGN